MTEKVRNGEQLLAIIIRHDDTMPGVNFLTDDDSAMQVGILNHPKSKIIQAHLHVEAERRVRGTQEVLFLRKGKLRVDFYDDDETYLKSRTLAAGDAILLIAGGHGFEVLEDIDMIEAKTGPYLGDKDKRRFDAAPPKPARGRR